MPSQILDAGPVHVPRCHGHGHCMADPGKPSRPGFRPSDGPGRQYCEHHRKATDATPVAKGLQLWSPLPHRPMRGRACPVVRLLEVDGKLIDLHRREAGDRNIKPVEHQELRTALATRWLTARGPSPRSPRSCCRREARRASWLPIGRASAIAGMVFSPRDFAASRRPCPAMSRPVSSVRTGDVKPNSLMLAAIWPICFLECVRALRGFARKSESRTRMTSWSGRSNWRAGRGRARRSRRDGTRECDLSRFWDAMGRSPKKREERPTTSRAGQLQTVRSAAQNSSVTPRRGPQTQFRVEKFVLVVPLGIPANSRAPMKLHPVQSPVCHQLRIMHKVEKQLQRASSPLTSIL